MLGSLVSEEAPRRSTRRSAIYMLPQGMFSVAVATVAVPAISRLAARRDLDGLEAHERQGGMRQIALLLIPAPPPRSRSPSRSSRLVYEGGTFDAESTDQTAEALSVVRDSASRSRART